MITVVYGDFDGELAIAVSARAAALVEAIPYVAAGVAGSAIGAYLAKKSKSSGKEKANDIPSWAKGEKPKEGESGKDYAKRLCDKKYGEGNYDKGPASDYNKLKKYGDRGGK